MLNFIPNKMSFKKLLLIQFLLPLSSFSQNFEGYEIWNGVNIGNEIKTVLTDSGFTFKYKDSLLYQEKFREIEKIKDGLIYICDSRFFGDNMSCEQNRILTIVEIMKSFKIVENSSFAFENDEHFYYGFLERFKELNEIGWAKKNGKFALITKSGKILSEFKYEDENCNYYIEPDKCRRKVYVITNKNGKEIFKSYDKIEKFWDINNYLTVDDKNSYFFTYKGKKKKIDIGLQSMLDFSLPHNSSVFTDSYNTDFYSLKGKLKNNNKYIPQTSFYNGQCIVSKSKDGKLEYFIVDEKLKVIKELNFKFEKDEELEFGKSDDFYFNKYGVVIFKNSLSNDCGLIDYNGNLLYEYPNNFIMNTNITEIYEGLYYIEEINVDKSTLKANTKYFFMNQKGEKIENCAGCKFEIGNSENYLTIYKSKIYTLDLDNNIKE